MVNAQISICRLGVASECIGFDPQVNAGFEAKGFSLTEGVELLGHVVKSRANLLRGTLAALKIARTGKRDLRDVEYSLHVIVEGRHIRTISADLSEVREAAISNGGWSIKNTIPAAMRARPFGPLRQNLLGPEGQLWMPLHSFFPLSKASAAVAVTLQFLAENKTTLADRGISTSCVTATATTHFMIEPSFYWQDSLGTLRLSMIEPEFQERWRDRPANQETRATVLKLRRELAAVYSAIGGTQQQIGKFYALQPALQPATWRTLEAIKRTLDPNDRMNPGCLGLGTIAQ
jgi:D-lactate dehydrogenase (cytochrome)